VTINELIHQFIEFWNNWPEKIAAVSAGIIKKD